MKKEKVDCKHKTVTYSKLSDRWVCMNCNYQFNSLEEWRKQKNERITN